jgi:hypothetical protein
MRWRYPRRAVRKPADFCVRVRAEEQEMQRGPDEVASRDVCG